jgi:hypothetical protein
MLGVSNGISWEMEPIRMKVGQLPTSIAVVEEESDALPFESIYREAVDHQGARGCAPAAITSTIESPPILRARRNRRIKAQALSVRLPARSAARRPPWRIRA